MASDTGSTEAPERRRYTRIGIRNALVLSFGTLIFVAISALLALNLWSGRETALQLLREQIQISVDLLENRVVAHVAPVIAANRDMAGAFNAMVAGVHWFETYVPRSIVRDLVKPGGATAAASSERDVTVLFTDIRRFTRLAEALPADETASFLNRHFTMLAECIEAEEGTIDKYIGDSVMAFWGAPHPSEDHAERACRSAIAMREALARDNAARTAAGQPPVEIGIGIHCGKVIAGNIGAPGRINYTLVGDAVNTAQRLEELSKTVGRAGGPARILISVQVARRLSGNYQAVPAGTHEIRGRYQTVDVFEIT